MGSVGHVFVELLTAVIVLLQLFYDGAVVVIIHVTAVIERANVGVIVVPSIVCILTEVAGTKTPMETDNKWR